MKQIIAILASTVLTATLFAQGNPDVTLTGTGSREVEPAYRIPVAPSVLDTSIQTPVVNYPLLNLKFETETELNKIDPASIRTKEQLSQLYHNYVKLGIGTQLMPLGEWYFDSKRSRKWNYGAHVKHLSSFGSLPDYAPSRFDRTGGLVYGALNERKYSVRAEAHYRNQGLHYYAFPLTTYDSLGLTRDSIKQRFSDFGIGGLFKWHKKDSAALNLDVGMKYNNFASMKPSEQRADWRAKENYFEIGAQGRYRLSSEVYGVDLAVKYNGFRYGNEDTSQWQGIDTALILNNTIVSLSPHITTHLFNNKFKAKIGADLTLNAHNITRAHIYPIAELKYSMFNDIFIPYVGLRGGMQQNTFKSLTAENEFLRPNVELRNQNTSIDFYGGIKGSLSKRISFNIGGSYANVKDMGLFVTDTMYSPLRNRFDIIYDTVNVTTITGSISYQLQEKLKVDAIANYYSYSAKNNSYAWNRPDLQVILRASYNLFDKFLFNLDLDLENGRRALVYEDGPEVTQENGQYIEKLNFIADANLGVEYRYNKRISAFVQANNIASQRYQRWYNTPVQGFQFLGGVTFRF